MEPSQESLQERLGNRVDQKSVQLPHGRPGVGEGIHRPLTNKDIFREI